MAKLICQKLSVQNGNILIWKTQKTKNSSQEILNFSFKNIQKIGYSPEDVGKAKFLDGLFYHNPAK